MGLYICLSCGSKEATNDIIDNNDIQNAKIIGDEIQKFRNYVFVIKFSNLIYNENGKNIKIPIFKGEYGDATYQQFIDYCIQNNMLEKGVSESGFVIEARKGEVKKTFHEFLNFYKNNFFKEISIDKPVKMFISGDEFKYATWDIYYDVLADNVPFVFHIYFMVSKKDWGNRNNQKIFPSVFELNPNEQIERPYIFYSIRSNYTTKDIFRE